jgi:hypothetical protein
MADDPKMSRRDWFRLRPRPAESNDKVSESKSDKTPNGPEHSMGETPNGLQAIAQPVNHDGMDLAELPPMREALLSEEQVRQLFSDIESLGSDVLLMQRSARSQRAAASTVTTEKQLRLAQATLLSGDVPRVQIRYHWQEANWIDTLERRDDGVRLIRIAHNTVDTATPGRGAPPGR